MNQIALRHRTVVLLTVLAALLPVCLVALVVVQRHRAAHQYLVDTEPRFARMLGLQKQRPELDIALARAKTQRGEYVRPATDDAAQTGNAAQQRIRDILSGAGLQIISSQVLPAKADKDVERIPISVRAEGDLLALQAALVGLSGQTPIIFLDDFSVQSQNAGPGADKKPVRLSIQFSLSVLRELS